MSLELSYGPRYNCSVCATPCDPHSKTAFIFEDDVVASENAEKELSDYLVKILGVDIIKTPPEVHGLPDLEVNYAGVCIARVEVKAQGRAFMSVANKLPKANLLPYETVALNLSDLERYIKKFHAEEQTIPYYIAWRVTRPCLRNAPVWRGNDLPTLERIYRTYRTNRRFTRKSTPSDYVNGEHKGVTVNYHFSLRELLPVADMVSGMKELTVPYTTWAK